jgi:hypothetical protein
MVFLIIFLFFEYMNVELQNHVILHNWSIKLICMAILNKCKFEKTNTNEINI